LIVAKRASGDHLTGSETVSADIREAVRKNNHGFIATIKPHFTNGTRKDTLSINTHLTAITKKGTAICNRDPIDQPDKKERNQKKPTQKQQEQDDPSLI
jgi:hypothetical protein